MPILTTTDPPRKRRAPVWLLILAVVVLPVVGLFAWSCYRPVIMMSGLRGVAFGRVSLVGPWIVERNNMLVGFKLPGGRATGWYVVQWIWLEP